MTRDTTLGLLLLVLAGAYYRAAAALPESELADSVGPGGLPKVYAGVLALLAVLLVAGSRRRVAGVPPAMTAALLRRVGGLLALGVLYVALLPWVGYPVAIAGLLVGTAAYQGRRLDRQVVTVGVVGALVFWAVFEGGLGIQFPTGRWLERLLGQS